MNHDDICTSYRDSPIHEFKTRTSSAAIDGRLDEIAQLMRERASRTVAPFGELGTFRVRVSPRFLTQDRDHSAIARAFGQGLDVLRVDAPLVEGDGNTMVALVRLGDEPWIARLGRPRDATTRGDWHVETFDHDCPGDDSIRLEALWSMADQKFAPDALGDSCGLMEDLRQSVEMLRSRRREARTTWRPAAVDLGELTLAVSGTLRNRSGWTGSALDVLTGGADDLYAYGIPENRQRPDLAPGLLLWLPRIGHSATLVSAPFPGAGPDDLLLFGLEEWESEPDILLVPVRAVWRERTLLGRRESTWREELRERFEDGVRVLERAALLPPRQDGLFRLKSFNKWVTANLRTMTGFTPEGLCDALSRGSDATSAESRFGGAAIRVRPQDSSWSFVLVPSRPAVGPGDWTLIALTPDRASASRPFARVRASWDVAGTNGTVEVTGDRDKLLQDLTVLWQEDERRKHELERAWALLAGISPRLIEMSDQWKELWELEREKLQVGVVGLRDAGEGTFLLTPLNSGEVQKELDRIREDNPEGVEWERYPLSLYKDPKPDKVSKGGKTSKVEEKSVKLRFTDDNDWAAGLSTFKVAPRDPERAPQLAELVRHWDSTPAGCGSSPDPTGSPVTVHAADPGLMLPRPGRLYLSNTEWNRVGEALAVFDPRTEQERLGRLNDEKALSPRPGTLRTLRTALIDPHELPSMIELPDLRWEPRLNLSEAQRRAVAMAVYGPDLSLIQGPPGTGKTEVIVEIIRQLFLLFGMRPSFRVLVVGPTHASVDNVLERLMRSDGGSPCLATELGITPYRLGSTKKVASHLQQLFHDCFHSSFLDDLRRQSAESLAEFESDREHGERLLGFLDRGARGDARGWSALLRGGAEWPGDLGRPHIPDGLKPEEETAAASQAGRAELWRNRARRRAERPQALFDLLREWKSFVDEESQFFNELQAAAANLVCATTVGCATTPQLKGAHYDYVIVDEAGKEESRNFLVPLLRGQRWILVGDHKQLPPYADDWLKEQAAAAGLPRDLLVRSLFEELQPTLEKCGRFVFLDRQGRMHPDISAFVSKAFYDGKLLDFEEKVSRRGMPGPRWLPSSPALQILDTRRLHDRFEQEPERRKFLNPTEADLAIRLVASFAALPEWQDRRITFGIIAPYGRQVDTIRAAAERDAVLAGLIKAGRLQVGTVDSFQGQERHLIVFSCTRSNDLGDVGFMDNLQRLNVALSRAMSRLIVIADSGTVTRRGKRDGSDRENRSGLKRLFRHVRAERGLVEVPADWRETWAVD